MGAFKRFLTRYEAKYPKTTEKLAQDRDALLAFYDFPAEHRKPARSCESPYAANALLLTNT